MLNRIIDTYKNKPLVKNSFWVIFGNGLGYFLLLIAGIIIARILGKDIYGEYGMVKTTMFYIASFSSFGLSYTSTKFIAEYDQRDKSCLRSIAFSSINITLITSMSLCIMMFVYADMLADFINAPQLMLAFRYLSVITMLRALSTVGAGLLAGFRSFKYLGVNNIIAGLVMLIFTVPATYIYGLKGSLFSLCMSQLILAVLNIFKVYRIVLNLSDQTKQGFYKQLLSFSFPIEIQEISYVVCNWGASLLITRYASLGEFGVYSACSQWYAIVLFLPGLLHSLVLSYLSGSVGRNKQSTSMFKKMLTVNFICAVIPFIIVVLASSLIVSFYGDSFIGMKSTLIILILATIPATLSNVYVADFLAHNRNWMLSILRVSRDIVTIVSLYIILKSTKGDNAASNYALLNVIMAFLFLGGIFVFGKKNH